jgi:AAA family ATP:ADP antiporter
MLLYTIGSTFLYFLQAQIVDATIEGRAAQTAYFANVDIWVNCHCCFFQCLPGYNLG